MYTKNFNNDNNRVDIHQHEENFNGIITANVHYCASDRIIIYEH